MGWDLMSNTVLCLVWKIIFSSKPTFMKGGEGRGWESLLILVSLCSFIWVDTFSERGKSMVFLIIAIKFVFVPDSPRSWNRSSFHVHTLPYQGATSLLRLFDHFSFDLPSKSVGSFCGTLSSLCWESLLRIQNRSPESILKVFFFLANFGS